MLLLQGKWQCDSVLGYVTVNYVLNRSSSFLYIRQNTCARWTI